MAGPITIRDLRPDDSIPEITSLLHAAYAGLAALGFRYVATYQDDDVTRRRLERGFPLVAEEGGRLIATVTLYPSRPDALPAWYRRPEVCYFGQFGVLPAYQKQGLGARLMDEVEKRAAARGAAEIALDTAEGAAHLIAWYERRGYRFIEYVQWPTTNYRSVVMSKGLGPLESSAS
ncbi:MAG TPA: GNAT family N-acetyltransferase [Candidatus Eisenbacteria bacterium]|nr:GNAT family N-acetyltransferase [Candidatus Eisenbacteria bacterium]